MTEQEKQELRQWNDAAKPHDRERDIPTKWIDALLDENAQLKSDIATITQEHSANNADLMKENAALREQNRKLELFNQDIVESAKKVQAEDAALREQVDELKMQYEGVKLVNIELQSKLNGYKVIYDSLNERYVGALKNNSLVNKQNARLVAMLESLEYILDANGFWYCPKCDRLAKHHQPDCSLGNLLAEVRKEK